MPVQVSLLKNKRVLVFQYTDPLSLTDIENSFQNCRFLYDEVSLPIHHVLDSQHLIYFPKNLLLVLQTSSKQADSLFRHPLAGTTFIVTKPTYAIVMASLIAGTLPNHRIEVFTSMNEMWARMNLLLRLQVKGYENVAHEFSLSKW